MPVVFTDSFTVASDIDLAAYPSGAPDYTYVRGTTGAITVLASSDGAFIQASAASVAAAITDASVPTGDQEITAQTHAISYQCGFLIARASPQSFYNTYLDFTAGNECQVYRRDNSTTQTLIASADRGLTAAGSPFTQRLKVTGTGATVTVEAQFAGTAVLTYADMSAERKTAGPPGIGGYAEATNTYWVDDVSVQSFAVETGAKGFFRARYFAARTWGARSLAATGAPPAPVNPLAGIIIAWPGTVASIPAGWTRVTALDGRYPKMVAAAAEPGTTGGAPTHTHTSPVHGHTTAHTHTTPNSWRREWAECPR